jgi:hypothetical protein
MRLNILRLTFEFKYPTIYDYQQVKKFINIVSNPTVRINMEDITYHSKPIMPKTQNQLESSHSHIVIYNEPDNIIKQLDNKIEEERLMQINNKIDI